MQKLLTFFKQNISLYAIFNDQSFNDMLTNDILSFEQLGSGVQILRINTNIKYSESLCFLSIVSK